MAELGFDMLEHILIKLDVEDLIQCKRVCKSWYSFVSSPCFVKSHLNRSYNNDLNDYGHRRIMMTRQVFSSYFDSWRIVGSSNGLVCITFEDNQLLVTNPSTKEVKYLPPPPCPHIYVNRRTSYWGFGYDSFIDDYKVIVGSMRGDHARFYVLTLKSNVWRLIKRVNYMLCEGSDKSGILCDGALHWFMSDQNKEQVILSLDLSSEEFKEIPQPDQFCIMRSHRLGIIRGCLCIYNRKQAFLKGNPYCKSLFSEKWIMRNYNSWKLCQFYDDDKINPDVVHYLKTSPTGILVGGGDHVRCSDGNWEYASAPIYVESLVSPHIDGETTDNKRSAKANSIYDESFPFSRSMLLERKRKWLPL